MDTSRNKIIAIIPARGGSKGIPRKNLVSFAGKPLIVWTILQALNSKRVDHVFVSTDDEEIERTALNTGAKVIKRPLALASDTATSEAALIHALFEIKKDFTEKISQVVFLQATSPLRLKDDIDNALETAITNDSDSLFSGAELGDFFVWEKGPGNEPQSLNYNYRSRKRRQDADRTYVENGSIYIFKPELLSGLNNRLGGKISIYPMKFWQSFEIDDHESLELCEWLFLKHLGGDDK